MALNQHSDIHDVLRKYWGYDGFRPLQQEIIESVLSGRDTLGLMPTGGGKSLTFQVPAMAVDGLALVITPIISLMKDQTDQLVARRIKATYLYSGLTLAEVNHTYEKCLYGNYKFLYISPERLSSKSFLDRLKHIPVSMIVVDEAHCISQWGYNFRPSYLRIAEVRRLFPDAPVLALTATATPMVIDDIMAHLAFKSKNVFRKSFARENISYVVRHTEDKYAELVHILSSVAGTAIVYVRSRRRTNEIATYLKQKGIDADHYHAGLGIEDKNDKQDRWKSGQCRVMVATNAFGMGIDKPDVRIVVHVDVPQSIEEYYQEAGRAGRDGNRAYAVLLTTHSDPATLHRHITTAFPERDFIRRVYELAGNFLEVAVGEGYQRMYDFNFNLFCTTYHLPILPTHSALRLLTQAGWIEFVEEIETQSRVMILARKEQLYNIPTTTEGADRVLQTLLRTYTGLFSDYVFVNEAVIERKSGVDAQHIYESLLELTRMHILHYVPRKRTPYIIYTTSREEPKHVLIPKTIYEEQRKRMSTRIEAMLNYAFDNNGCRESKMLAYFGEQDSAYCGHCDLCIDRRKRNSVTPDEVGHAILAITQAEPQTLETILKSLRLPKEMVLDSISFLVDEGFLEHLSDGRYFRKVP